MKEFITKRWKEILLGFFILFSLTKCTQSCNTSIQNKKLTNEISIRDTTIDSLQQEIVKYVYEINTLNTKIESQDLTITRMDKTIQNQHKIDSINAAQKQIQIVERIVEK